MARALIVGCGCRGRALAAALRADGHQVRGTTRDPQAVPAIEAAGVEAVVADPLRLATLMGAIDGVAVVCWLMGNAHGPPEQVEALHRSRLESLIEMMVDTHARALVYEAAGTVDAAVLAGGASLARRRAAAHRMPIAVVSADPSERAAWLVRLSAAVADGLA